MSLLNPDMQLGFRFSVVFLARGILPDPIDLRFQKVGGLSLRVKTTSRAEGGQNLFRQWLPESVEHDNLVLERGVFVGSPVDLTMTFFKFKPATVLVSLLNEHKVPQRNWFFFGAYPVRWSTADLDARSHEVLIETLELKYQRMNVIAV